jgi:ssDNA-binding replication factor A large subunit
MKTFREFILEATIQELRAKARMLRQKGDDAGALEVEKQAGELQVGTQAKIDAATRDKPRDKPRENTWVSGKPSKPRDTSRRGGSLPNIAASADDNMARRGQRTTGRYTGNQHGQTGSGGTGTDSTGASKLGGRR